MDAAGRGQIFIVLVSLKQIRILSAIEDAVILITGTTIIRFVECLRKNQSIPLDDEIRRHLFLLLNEVKFRLNETDHLVLATTVESQQTQLGLMSHLTTRMHKYF